MEEEDEIETQDEQEQEVSTLTPRQESFAVAYASLDSPTYGLPTQAAISAGYSEAYARTAAWKNRRVPQVAARIQQIFDANTAKLPKIHSDLEFIQRKALAVGDLGTATRCCEIAAKMLGAFKDTMTIDVGVTRQLSDDERREARRISAILVHEQVFGRLPEPMLDNVPVIENNTFEDGDKK